MKESNEDKIIEKLDEVIELANNTDMIKSYPTFAIADIIKKEYEDIISLLPPSPDIGENKDT